MENAVRDSGIGVIGKVPWGTHFCLFYETKDDLIDVLVPYFQAGLENNEFCMCVTSEPLNEDEVRERMARAIPGFNDYLENGQMEILTYDEWYEIDGVFDSDRVLNGWVEKLRRARERGFSGLRLTGNTFWLEKAGWKEFLDYEDAVNEAIGQHNMIALCTYSLGRCDAGDVLDVVGTHQFALTRREGEWKLIESVGLRETREALQKSEAGLARAQEIAHLGSWEWDLASNRVDGSEELYRMFGLTPDPATFFQQYIDRIVLEDRQRVLDALDETIKKNVPYDIDYRVVLTDGSRRFIHAEAVTSYEHGKPVKVFGIAQDITERKQVEEALRRSEASLKKSQEIAHVGSWELDIVNNKLSWSDEAYRIFGLRPREFGATYEAFLEAVHPDDRAAVDAAYTGSIREGRNSYEIEHRVVRRSDHQVRIVHEKCEHIRDEAGRIIRSQGMTQDITERKQAEAELADAKARAELYLDLMGHDINNLNQVAMGYLEIADETLILDETDRELLSKPLEALRSSTHLIENVRKLQRLKEGGLKTDVVDLKELLVGLRKQYDNAGEVAIGFEPEDGCRVMVNGLIQDVFANLIGNAIKHSNGRDRVEINIKMDKPSDDGKEYCRVAVEDNGPGIPDDLKRKLFNRFQRGDTKASGKGLGLYLVRTLVEDFHGRVWVEDRIKGDHTQGARFVVMLPAVEK